MSSSPKAGPGSAPVNWNWPVQIGFIRELTDQELERKFAKYHWLSKLTHRYFISRVRKRANILVLYGTMQRIGFILDKTDYLIGTDLLLLFLESKDEIPLDFDLAVKNLKNLRANSYRFTVDPGGDGSLTVLENLVFNLAHNEKLNDVISKIGISGEGLLTEQIIKASRLNNVSGKILSNVKKSVGIKAYNFEQVITQNIRFGIEQVSGIPLQTSPNSSPYDILNELRDQKKTFRYGHESDEATIMKRIAINHSSNVSDMIDMIGTDLEVVAPGQATSKRYLQCLLRNKANQPIHHALLTNQPYTLVVKIDTPNENFLQGGEVTDDDVPVTPGDAERVDLFVRCGNTTLQDNILLSKSGASTEAKFPISIELPGETRLEIFAFHKNRLFQQLDLSAYACETEEELVDVAGIKVVMINMPRTTLSDFEIKQKYGLSVVFTDGLPVMAHNSKITEITDEDHISEFNKKLKEIIEGYVVSASPSSDDLIFALADQGALLYRNVFSGIDVFDKPIQVISSNTKHFPLEFLYTKKLHKKASKLCSRTAEAMNTGNCLGCNAGDEKYICPLGFLSLSTVIERHRVGENVDFIRPDSVGLKTDVTVDRPAMPILQNTLFGSSEKVDNSVEGLRKRLAEKIKRCSTHATEVEDWDTWYHCIKAEMPESLVIIGHVEGQAQGGSNQLEIGQDLLRQAVIDDRYVRAKEIIHPFLVLIGCSTQDVELSFLDFTNHFKRCGAAIVLSTFTKIRGSQAVPLVEGLMDLLHKNKDTEVTLGEVMLQLRRRLFAEELYMSMALVSHGDADWNLKI